MNTRSLMSKLQNIKDFARGIAYIRVGNNDYKADIVIANRNNRLYLYDIVNLDKAKIKERSNRYTGSANSSSNRWGASSNNSISNNSQNSNTQTLNQSRYTPKTYEEALKQNAKYQEVIENLKAQMKVTKGHKVGRDGIIRLTNKLVRDTKTIKDKMEIRNQLNEVFDKAAKSKWDAEQTIEELKPIVLEALNERSANRKRLPYATEILGDLRRRRIKLDDTQKSEIEYSSGMKYNDWRKSMMGKIIIAEDGRSLDSVWSELSAIYPDTFNEEISSADQPGELDYIIYTLQNTYEEDYGFNLKDAAEFYAAVLVAEYARLPEVMTYADKQQAKLVKMQEDYQVAVGAIKKEYENKQKELEKEYKTNISEARALWRAEQINREWYLKEFYKEKIKQREESIRNREDSVWSTRSKEKVRNHIIKTVKSISTQLVNPTNARHIPEEFRKTTVEFCRLFTENTSVFDYKRLNELAIAYGKIEATTDLTVDEDMKEMIDGLRDLVEGKRLSQLNRVELEMVKDIVDHFNHLIKTANQLFVEGKQVELFDWGNKALDELQAQGEKVQIRSDYEGINSLLDGKDQFFENNKTPVYFFKGLGDTFNSLFADIRGGQDRFGRNIANAKKYIDDVQEKYNFNKWSMSDKIKLTDDIQLDREQAMYLYATYKRERNNTSQEARHLEEGGIIIDSVEVEKKKVIRKTKRQKQGYKVNVSDMTKISDFLTAEQKAYVDAMVAYMSKDMAELGNETSMKLHGITKYHEKYYFPYKVASSELNTPAEGEKRPPSLSRPGFSKSVTKGANNAVVIGNFSETCATHINQMCLYNGLAVAQDNLNRVYNFKDIRWGAAEGQNIGTGLTVKKVLENAKGEQATTYMSNFITSLNNGIQSDPMNTVSHMLVSKFKKGATLASASVTIQQISSVVRAMAVIDPKHFTKVKFNSKLWEECKKYNGVAVIKEMGGFDTGIGRGTVEYLVGKRAKALPGKMYNKVDELAGKAPAYMDKVAWCNIWSAIKSETKEKYNLKGNEEEFFKRASERFDEVINSTQVYDSVISKSLNMQSKDGLMQMITAFMAEPTLTYNLLMDSVNSKNKKYMARVLSAVTVQIAVNSALKALVQAARNGKDEDEDKSYLEKWAKSFSDNFAGDIWPHNMIPILRDISSMLQGYDVERTDMTIISELVDSMTMVYDFVSGDSNKTTLEVITALGTSISAAVGLPAGNVVKDIRGAFNLVNDSLEGNILPENSEDIIVAFREGLGYKYSINDEAKEYISTGDKEVLKDMIEYQVEQIKDKYPSYSDEKILEKAKSNVRSSLTKQLKEDYITGIKEERNEILQIMQESGVYTTTKDGVEVDESNGTVIGWEVNALKAQYIATTSATERNEIRKKLYATGKWKSLTKLDEQLKKWIE